MSGWGDRRGRDGGGDRWGDRRRDDRRHEEGRSSTIASGRPEHHQHTHEGRTTASHTASSRTEPIKVVQIDALVFLQIMKHCRQHTPSAVTGMLLGLDVDDALQVTHSFGYIQQVGNEEGGGNRVEEGRQYQMDMLKRLREVNVDSNTVGWYQSTHLGQFLSPVVIDTQYDYQADIPRSVLIVYDALQSAIGKPAFKALQLTPEFMKTYGEASDRPAALADFPSNEMFMELPVSITSSVIMEAFLVDWAIQDPFSTTSQVGILDVENQAFLEKNVQLLIGSLQELEQAQQQLINFERQAARKGEPPQKGGRDRFRQNVAQPKPPIETMIFCQQIQNYCKAINGFASDAFGKIYLMSNKPSGIGGSQAK